MLDHKLTTTYLHQIILLNILGTTNNNELKLRLKDVFSGHGFSLYSENVSFKVFFREVFNEIGSENLAGIFKGFSILATEKDFSKMQRRLKREEDGDFRKAIIIRDIINNTQKSCSQVLNSF